MNWKIQFGVAAEIADDSKLSLRKYHPDHMHIGHSKMGMAYHLNTAFHNTMVVVVDSQLDLAMKNTEAWPWVQWVKVNMKMDCLY